MFITDINNRTMVRTNISCSIDGFIDIETGYDSSFKLCGYWTFSNQTPFLSCPINCTSMLPPYFGTSHQEHMNITNLWQEWVLLMVLSMVISMIIHVIMRRFTGMEIERGKV